MSNPADRPSIEELREALQRIHRVALGESDRAYMSIPADPKRDADLMLAAALDELEQLRGLRPELPPRPFDATTQTDGAPLPRYGLRWNGAEQPLAVPMADGYWTPWHLAEADWRRCMRERSSDLEGGEAAVAVAKGLREQRDQMAREAERLRARVAELTPLVPTADQVVVPKADYERLIASLPAGPRLVPR